MVHPVAVVRPPHFSSRCRRPPTVVSLVVLCSFRRHGIGHPPGPKLLAAGTLHSALAKRHRSAWPFPHYICIQFYRISINRISRNWLNRCNAGNKDAVVFECCNIGILEFEGCAFD